MQLGSVAEWIAAVGTIGTLALGLAILARERSIARRKSADDFITWVTLETMFVLGVGPRPLTVVHGRNNGTHPVKTPLIAYTDRRGGAMTQVLSNDGRRGVITPGAEVAVQVRVTRRPAHPIFVLLQDATGRQWLRYADEHRYPNFLLSQALYLVLALFERRDGASTRKVRARERERERLSADREVQGPEHPAAPNTTARAAVRECRSTAQ